MSLDGLRAWIGEVERKLGMRTRVFLVLATIAIGGAGAAIYLAIDTRDNAVSESDVQELQERLEARIDESAATPAPSESSQPGGTTGEAGATPEGSKARLRELLEQAKEQNEQTEEEQQGK